MATRPPIGMPKLSRRAKVLLSIAGALILVLILGARLLDTYVNWLWFGELGFRSVFTTVLLTRITLFFAIGLLVGGLLAISLIIAYRTRPVFVPVTGADDPLAKYRSTIVQRVRLFGIAIPVVVGAIAGAAGQGDWQVVQLWMNGVPFGQTDPEFGKDIGFYAFTLPFISWLITWLFVGVAIAGIGALITHYVFGGIRVGTKGDNFSVPARVQLSVTAGIFVVILGVDYFFERYELLFSTRNELFDGATYTDLNAVLPAKLILMFIAGFCAVAFFVGAFIRNLQLPAIAIVLLILSSILVGWAWPTVLEQVSVKPNAAEKEAQSIERSITATRQAFGLTEDKVTTEEYDTSTGVSAEQSAEIKADTATIPNLRLLDPSLLSRTFKQIQGAENFYNFPQYLDVDRYEVNGTVQDYVVAARELDPSLLAENQTAWINRHMVYTHGDGFIAAPANRINRALEDDEATGEQDSGAPDSGDPEQGGGGGYPVFEVSDQQAVNAESDMAIPVEQPRIYYGELSTDYAIVNARPEYNAASREQNYRYEGAGGVPIGSLFNQFVFFAHYGERNFLFNSDINENSKIMYDRQPRQRVEKAAPWLTVDTDPYPAVVDGRIVWIVDGYTTLDNYPYSKGTALGEATTDTLSGVARQANRDIGYIRNSVKAVVDAYDGKVTLYAIDGQDPVLKAWENIFPGSVSHELLDDKSGKFDELKSHFRYPEDLFKVQRELLTRYHVSSPGQFYETNSFWSVPSDPTAESAAENSAAKQPPYYMLAQTPGQDKPTFQLTSGLTLLNSNFLSAWVSVSSDPDDYGTIRVLELSDRESGPVQVQDRVRNTPRFAQDRTLFSNNNNQVDVRFGNLLTIPIAGGLLYMEPIYIQQRSENSFPQLARVIVYFGGDNNEKIGVAPTVQEALEQVFGAGAGDSAPQPEQPPEGEETPPTTTPPPTGGLDPAVEQAARDLVTARAAVDAARTAGDYVAEGQARAQSDAAEQALLEALGIAGGQPAGNGGG